MQHSYYGILIFQKGMEFLLPCCFSDAKMKSKGNFRLILPLHILSRIDLKESHGKGEGEM